MNPDKDFEQNMKQLVKLLKKMMMNLPSQGSFSDLPFFSNHSGTPGNGINLNLCVFAFLPVSPEDFEEIEDLYEQNFFHDEKVEDFSGKLNAEDIDFLRRNGIRF